MIIKPKSKKKVKNPNSESIENLLGKTVKVYSKYSNIQGRLTEDDEWKLLYHVEVKNADTYFRISDIKNVHNNMIYLIDIIDKY